MSKYISELLRRYQQGTCTQQERLLVEQWLDEHPLADSPLDNDTIEEHLRLNKRIIDNAIQKGRAINWNRWLQAAAVTVFALGTATLFWLNPQKNIKKQAMVQDRSNLIAKQLKNGWWYLHTPKGKSYTDTLSDGSIITLNAGSKVHFPAVFAASKRPVYLDDGEALFKVAKDKTRPFTVYSPGFSTTALGTEFNIRTYDKEHKVAVALLHGKILVKDLRKSATAPEVHILLPHQQLIAASLQSRAVQSAFSNEDDIIGWESGFLNFRDADAAEVINRIENHFNVTVINKSAKVHWSYTGTFRHETLPEVLKTISLIEEINYTIHNQTVTLY